MSRKTKIILVLVFTALFLSGFWLLKVRMNQEGEVLNKETVEVGCGDGVCNEGERTVDCPGDCNKYFPNFDIPSSDFDALMTNIGVDRSPVVDDVEKRKRLEKILRWLAVNRLELEGKKQQECYAYVKSVKDYDGWESPEVWGKVYARFGKICPGTCFSTSHAFTMLVYKAGISEEDFQMIGRQITANNDNQHWWTRVKIGGKWIEVDPLCASPGITFSGKKNIKCNRAEVYHPCRYITVSQEGEINSSSWHCKE